VIMDREIEEKDIRLFYEKVYSFIGHDAFKVTDIAKAFDITSRKATSLLTKLIESNNAIRYWVKNELYYRLNAEYDPSGHTFIYKYLNKCNVPKTKGDIPNQEYSYYNNENSINTCVENGEIKRIFIYDEYFYYVNLSEKEVHEFRETTLRQKLSSDKEEEANSYNEGTVYSYLYAYGEPLKIDYLCKCKGLESVPRYNIKKALDTLKSRNMVKYESAEDLYEINDQMSFNRDYDWRKEVSIFNDKFNKKQKENELEEMEEESFEPKKKEVVIEKEPNNTIKIRKPQIVSLDERLYSFISSQDTFVSYKKIREEKQFENDTDIEILKVLEKLKKEKVVFSCTYQDVTYFSIVEDVANLIEMGEKDVEGISKAIGKILLESNGNVDIINNLIKTYKEKNFNDKDNFFDLTFDNNIKLDFSDYIIPIPDNFTYNTNIEGKEFVAWLLNENEEDEYFSSPLKITANKKLPFPFDYSSLIIDKEAIKIINELNTYVARSDIDMIGLVSDCKFEIFHNDRISASFLYSYIELIEMWNCLVSVTMSDGFVVFTISIKDESKCLKIDQIKEMVFRWVNKIQLKNKPETLTKCDAKAFFSNKLNTDLYNHWICNYEKRISHIQFIKENRQEIADMEYEVKKEEGIASLTVLRANQRSILIQAAEKYDELINEIVNAFKLFIKKESNNPLLLKMYEEVVEKFPQDELSIRINSKEIYVNMQSKNSIIDKIMMPEIKLLMDKKIAKDIENEKTEEKKKALTLKEEREKKHKELLQSESEYKKICSYLEAAVTVEDYLKAKVMFKQLGDYKISQDLAKYCEKMKYILIYEKAIQDLNIIKKEIRKRRWKFWL